MPRPIPKYSSELFGRQNFGPTQNLASDDELEAITKGAPRLLRIRLAQALSTVEYCLRQNPHISETWKELLEMIFASQSELKKYVAVRTLPDGTNVNVPMVVDTLCFKYPELKNAVFELGRVLAEIENLDPSLYMSAVIYKEAQRISASGKKIDGDVDEKIVKALTNGDYLNAKHGEKGEIKRRIADKHSVSGGCQNFCV